MRLQFGSVGSVIRVVVLLAGVALVAAGCLSPQARENFVNPTGPATTVPNDTLVPPGVTASTFVTSSNNVIIQGFAFHAPTITVKAGTTITWTNLDGVDHTVTSVTPGLFNTGDIGTNQSASLRFKFPGVYKYYCAIHPYMHGTVVVTK